MLRRLAITLAAVSAAGFLSTVPAAAAVARHDGGHSVSGGYHSEGGHAGFEHVNLGGPYGITKTSGFIGGYESEGGFSYHGHGHH